MRHTAEFEGGDYLLCGSARVRLFTGGLCHATREPHGGVALVVAELRILGGTYERIGIEAEGFLDSRAKRIGELGCNRTHGAEFRSRGAACQVENAPAVVRRIRLTPIPGTWPSCACTVHADFQHS